VLGFRSSDALGGAYGIAVTGTMTVDTVLAFTYFRLASRWRLWPLAPLFGLFLLVDLSFFAANLLKIEEGGWFPLVIAGGMYVVMMTWVWGRARIAAQRASSGLPLETLIDTLKPDRPVRVPGTGIYMTARVDNVPAALLHDMKHNKVLHERNVLMNVHTEEVPRLPEAERLEIHHLDHNFHTVKIRYGFLEEPDTPEHWRSAGRRVPVQPDGDIVFCRPREDRRQARFDSQRAVQATLHVAVEDGARRDRVLQNPGKSDRRAGRPGRALDVYIAPRRPIGAQ